MLQVYECSDGNCDDGDTRCASKSICNDSCISSETTFSDPSCTTHSGDHDQCDATLEKGWEGGVPAEGETGTWAREGCYSAGNEGEVGSCLSDGKVTNQRVRCDSNTDPTANNDSVSMKECTKSATIDVLDNDTDDDGDNIEIKSVEDPSNGTAYADNGKIVYTPDNNNGNKFSYTIKDGNGGEDTAQVDVSFSSCQGSISVQVEDQSGNPVSVDNVDINFAGNSSCPSESNTSGYTCTVDLSDTCENGSYSISDSDYNVVGRGKSEEGDTGISSKTETCLGY